MKAFGESWPSFHRPAGVMMGDCNPSDANWFHIVLPRFVVLRILSELGIDVGPLLAGAKIVGLAVSFGAQ